MVAAGMEIGCHGDQHLMLTALARDAQAREIDGALRVLDATGRPRMGFAYCYAKGEHNADSVELLRARGCAIALTTRVALAAVAPETMLTVPRIDANDLPVDGAAPPNDWTLRAMEGGA
jgi:peptidoglycan/xylan/chitin deacetylase (PgdA/CDA1 family)